jgi:hypothetical protein
MTTKFARALAVCGLAALLHTQTALGAALVVTNTDALGEGSLLGVIDVANENGEPDTIVFAEGITDIGIARTVTISAPHPVNIDGGDGVRIHFTGQLSLVTGLSLESGGHTISNLQFDGFTGAGVRVLEGSDAVSLLNLEIGNVDGRGIEIQAHDAVVQGCVVGAVGGVLAPVALVGIAVVSGDNTLLGLDAGGAGVGNTVLGTPTGIQSQGTGTGRVIRGNAVGVNPARSLVAPTAQHGIVSTSPNALIQDNLVVGSGWAGIAVATDSAAGTRVLGNRIEECGFNDSPTFPKAGILISGIDTGEVGGPEPGELNVIVACNIGLEMQGDLENVLARANRIGVEADGVTPNGNASHGVVLTNPLGGTVGGAAAAGNIIANNGGHGVASTDGNGHQILGNRIGVNALGAAAPNALGGLLVSGTAVDFEVGALAAPNLIAANGGDGIEVLSGTRLFFSANAIFDNAGAGIALAPGVNGDIAPPVVTGTSGPVTGTASPGATVEVFVDAADEGAAYLGEAIADGGGLFSLAANMAPHDGLFVTATATLAADGTSAFSAPVAVSLAPQDEDHSADQNGDQEITLSELLRVIQFYNSSRFGCDPQGEDGFAPNATDESCPPHASDYNPQDWRIVLTELLRLIQFYNSGGYVVCGQGEDGFCPA